MRFSARLQNLLFDEAQDGLWVLDFKSLKKTQHITIPSIYDFDSICKTLNQNTKPSPNKEISLIDNLARWLQGLQHSNLYQNIGEQIRLHRYIKRAPQYWLPNGLTRTLNLKVTPLQTCLEL